MGTCARINGKHRVETSRKTYDYMAKIGHNKKILVDESSRSSNITFAMSI